MRRRYDTTRLDAGRWQWVSVYAVTPRTAFEQLQVVREVEERRRHQIADG